MIAGVVVLHIWALHLPGSNNPLGIDVKGPQDTIPFHPYYTVKDCFGLGVFLICLAGFVFFAPNFFGDPDNYIPANPLVTPPDIVPEWYFLPFYAILRSIPNKLLGVHRRCSARIGRSLFFLPWLDTLAGAPARFRPIYQAVLLAARGRLRRARLCAAPIRREGWFVIARRGSARSITSCTS